MELTPITRKENFLAKAAGDQNALDLEPITREEWFISQIQGGGGGGGAVTSVNGKTGAVVLDPDDVGAEPEKLIVTVTKSGGVYSADKTWTEITTAYNNGKMPVVKFVDDVYELTNTDGSDFFFSVYIGGKIKQIDLSSAGSDIWSYSEIVVQSAPSTVAIFGTTPTITPAANTVYNCGELTSLTISNPPATGKYSVIFFSGATPTTTVGIENFVAEANKRYKITVEDNYATYDSWATS